MWRGRAPDFSRRPGWNPGAVAVSAGNAGISSRPTCSRAPASALRRAFFSRFPGGAAAGGDGLFQHVLNLAVDAAQFIRRPGLEVVPEGRIDAQEEFFLFAHCRITERRAASKLAG